MKNHYPRAWSPTSGLKPAIVADLPLMLSILKLTALYMYSFEDCLRFKQACSERNALFFKALHLRHHRLRDLRTQILAASGRETQVAATLCAADAVTTKIGARAFYRFRGLRAPSCPPFSTSPLSLVPVRGPYIHKFRHQTFVVGLTGEAIDAGKLGSIVQDLAMIQAMGVKIVLVHGFRPRSTSNCASGPGAALLQRHARDRLHRSRLRPGSGRPAALRDRSRLQPGPAQHTHGRCARARDLGNFLTARPWALSTAWTSCTRVWCARWTWKAFAAHWTPKPWCWSRPSASRPRAKPSISAWKKWRPAWP